MKRFLLYRDSDDSGVSGTGVVAEGVMFTDGTAVMRWVSEHTSTAVYRSVEDIKTIHGHGGATKLVWIDEQEPVSDVQPSNSTDI